MTRHEGQPVFRHGPAAAAARRAVILVHGRGGSAHEMLGLARELGTGDVAYLAPQAEGNTWYPYSFLAPIEQNEPGISSGMRVLSGLIDALGHEGMPPAEVVLLGFSQGACLATEFAARHARRFGGVVGLSGGLIGPAGTARSYVGSLDDTPVFLGCSDVDPHIPLERVHETAEVLRRLHAKVDERIYPRMGHTINEDELEAVRALLAS
jgi:predicted esterase